MKDSQTFLWPLSKRVWKGRIETHLLYKDGENNFKHDQHDLMEYETYDCLKESSW